MGMFQCPLLNALGQAAQQQGDFGGVMGEQHLEAVIAKVWALPWDGCQRRPT